MVVAISLHPPLAAKLAGIGHAAGPLLWLAPMLWLRLLPWVPWLMLRLVLPLLRGPARLLSGRLGFELPPPVASSSPTARPRMHTMATAPPVNQRRRRTAPLER